jgi:hypothetical protein
VRTDGKAADAGDGGELGVGITGSRICFDGFPV